MRWKLEVAQSDQNDEQRLVVMMQSERQFYCERQADGEEMRFEAPSLMEVVMEHI